MFDIDKSLKKMLGTTRKRGGPKDWDGDGVPNKKDCQPRNVMRQDNLKTRTRTYTHYPIPKSTKEMNQIIDENKTSVRGSNYPKYFVKKTDSKRIANNYVKFLRAQGLKPKLYEQKNKEQFVLEVGPNERIPYHLLDMVVMDPFDNTIKKEVMIKVEKNQANWPGDVLIFRHTFWISADILKGYK